MAFRHYRQAREAAEVNLIPVMNLFVVLIPFLLMSAAFYHVAVIPTSFPSQTEGKSDIASNPREVTINLAIRKERIQMSASSASLDEETLAGLSVSIPRQKKGFDLEQLRKALYAIKLEYPDSDTAILLPGPDTEYQDVVRVLDTAREITLNPGTPQEERKPLFPVVVMSSMVETDE